MELETFRDIVCQQIDTLQGYFDACAGTGVNQKQAPLADAHGSEVYDSNDGCKSLCCNTFSVMLLEGLILLFFQFALKVSNHDASA